MINDYGWSDALARQFEPFAAKGWIPGRVTVQQRGLWGLITPQGDVQAELSGRFVHEAGQAGPFSGGHPVAGDWVAVSVAPGSDRGMIQAVLPRSGAFTRQGPAGMQVVAANVDVALLAASLNADLSLRRIERYLANTYESGAVPVIVLTKSDDCDDVEAKVAQVEAVAFGVPVLAVSAVTGEGLEALQAYLEPGRTAVILGSSGVGKSTLVNALAGAEVMTTQGIIEEGSRGKHTTTHRELFRLPTCALLLDTPGMREIGVYGAGEGVETTFADIDELALSCRFSDCKHGNEPGCAVRTAIEDGALDETRFNSFRKLQRELAFEERKEDPVKRAQERAKWVAVSRSQRAMKKQWGKEGR